MSFRNVFYYPGATVGMINKHFQADEKRATIDASSVKNIVLMCGSNDVDTILNSPRHLRETMLKYGQFKSNARNLDKTNHDIDDLTVSLHKWAPNAKIQIINLLPRESRSRNEVISDINLFISNIQKKHSFVNMVSTEKDRFLFTDKFGFRKPSYFSMKGDDNIHLNNEGVIKLAKHLKYHAHH